MRSDMATVGKMFGKKVQSVVAALRMTGEAASEGAVQREEARQTERKPREMKRQHKLWSRVLGTD